MQAMLIEQYGSNTPLVLRDIPTPVLQDDEILAEIYAASINPIDFKIRDGKVKMLLSYDMPLILGNDFSGVVAAVGSKVTRFKVGDEIYGRPRKSHIGTLAEFLAVHEDDIALKPTNTTFAEAAGLPLVGLTVYQALHDIIRLQRGNKILIHAGAGGVGTFAIQMAKQMGAYVATTASDAGYALVKSLGADEIINYKTERFQDRLSHYDAVLDTLGGEALLHSFAIVKPGGRIVSVSGLPNARFARENQLPLWKTLLFAMATHKLTRLEKKYGVHYDFLFMKASGAQLAEITRLVEANSIIPVVDKVFPFAQAQAAMAYSESGRAKGKVIVDIKSTGQTPYQP